MKKFNSNKYLKKIKFKKFWHNYSKYFYIILSCICTGILGIYFAHSLFFVSKEKEVVKTTVGSFIYVADKVVCDNNAVGVWNDLTWDLNVSHITKRTKCNVYFKTSKITDRIIASVDKTGKCPSVNSDGTVNVTKVESTDGYVCSAPDAYGTSYYFRGNVTNNYVKFGGFYWRILRINGDGTIRLVYDGTSAHNNNEASSDRIIGDSKYNSSADDNAYVGYMYGKTGSSNYNDTHATVSFTCPQQNDAFTVSDTSKGNGALTYPIGLLSGDDITLAGCWNSANNGYYLYTGNKYWTASAGSCTIGITGNRSISEDGSTPNFGINSNSASVKPVINIKADSLIAGLGLKEKPYVLSVD